MTGLKLHRLIAILGRRSNGQTSGSLPSVSWSTVVFQIFFSLLFFFVPFHCSEPNVYLTCGSAGFSQRLECPNPRLAKDQRRNHPCYSVVRSQTLRLCMDCMLTWYTFHLPGNGKWGRWGLFLFSAQHLFLMLLPGNPVHDKYCPVNGESS